MALPASGQISLLDIATEFGGTVPHAINEYYRSGGLVPDTPANATIPTAGQVSFNQYYGGAATLPTYSVLGDAVAGSADKPAAMTFRIKPQSTGTLDVSTVATAIAGGVNFTVNGVTYSGGTSATATDTLTWGSGPAELQIVITSLSTYFDQINNDSDAWIQFNGGTLLKSTPSATALTVPYTTPWVTIGTNVPETVVSANGQMGGQTAIIIAQFTVKVRNSSTLALLYTRDFDINMEATAS